MVRRFATSACTLLVAFTLFASPARADDKSEMDAVAQKSAAALVAGNVAAFAALGAPANQTAMDDFGRHYWSGPDALANWLRDFKEDLKSNGISDITFTLAPAKFSQIDGPRAWASYPASYTYKMKGTMNHETGVLVITFEKVSAGWRMLGIAWARTS